jgi:hypothetical protein
VRCRRPLRLIEAVELHALLASPPQR